MNLQNGKCYEMNFGFYVDLLDSCLVDFCLVESLFCEYPSDRSSVPSIVSLLSVLLPRLSPFPCIGMCLCSTYFSGLSTLIGMCFSSSNGTGFSTGTFTGYGISFSTGMWIYGDSEENIWFFYSDLKQDSPLFGSQNFKFEFETKKKTEIAV